MKLNILSIIAAFAILLTVSSCEKEFICVKPGSGETTQTFDLADFTGFNLCVAADVEISQGTQSFEVTGPTNLVENLELEVKNGVLNIDYDKCVWNSKDMNIKIALPMLTEASISGSGDIVGTSAFEGLEDLDLKISGSGNIDLEVTAINISSNISGSGKIILLGSGTTYESKISGSGDIEAFDLTVDDCSVKISGSGKNEVSVNNNLDVKISGSGDVYYKGNPLIDVNLSGSGELINAN